MDILYYFLAKHLIKIKKIAQKYAFKHNCLRTQCVFYTFASSIREKEQTMTV